MKPAKFDYHDPTTLDEALGLMAQFGDQARPLAGGQSLVPLMNFRLIRPAHLIDLNGVNELSYLESRRRHAAHRRDRPASASSNVRPRLPRVGRCCARRQAFIGHIQIRNRGTVGGSLAHAFPSAELPVAMVTLDASLVLRSTGNRRTVRAEDFFLSFMTTVLEPERTFGGNKRSATTGECRLLVPRSQPAAWRLCAGGGRCGPRSRRQRRHPSCPADAYRHDADPGASKRKNFCSGKSRRKSCFETRRGAPLKTWNRIRIFTPVRNTAATPARRWRDARSRKRQYGRLSG